MMARRSYSQQVFPPNEPASRGYPVDTLYRRPQAPYPEPTRYYPRVYEPPRNYYPSLRDSAPLPPTRRDYDYVEPPRGAAPNYRREQGPYPPQTSYPQNSTSAYYPPSSAYPLTPSPPPARRKSPKRSPDPPKGKNQKQRPPDPPPNSSIMFRGLSSHTTESMMAGIVKSFGPVVSVKIITDRPSGKSKGIGFVEFERLADAKAFYDHYKQPNFPHAHKILIDGVMVDLKYSTNRHAPGTSASKLSKSGYADWICPLCNTNNFSKRKECFQCKVPKPGTPGCDKIPEKPAIATSTLTVSNLSPNTDEKLLSETFSTFAPVRNCRLLKDKEGNCTTALVEFFSVEEATAALKQSHSLLIDNSTVRVSYARQNNPVSQAPEISIGNPAEMKSHTEHAPQSASQTPIVCDLNALEGVPDAEDYVYDLDSGFYFNPTINFYFDAKTRYFYDINEKSFYSYDQTLKKFVKLDSANTQQTEQEVVTKAEIKDEDIDPALRGLFEISTGVICILCRRKFPSNEALLKHNQRSKMHKRNLWDGIENYLKEHQQQSIGYGESQAQSQVDVELDDNNTAAKDSGSNPRKREWVSDECSPNKRTKLE